MRHSKTNTTWFIARSSKNSWSLGVGCVRLLPSASRQEVASLIQNLGTSNFYYFPQYHVVFVYCSAACGHEDVSVFIEDLLLGILKFLNSKLGN